MSNDTKFYQFINIEQFQIMWSADYTEDDESAFSGFTFIDSNQEAVVVFCEADNLSCSIDEVQMKKSQGIVRVSFTGRLCKNENYTNVKSFLDVSDVVLVTEEEEESEMDELSEEVMEEIGQELNEQTNVDYPFDKYPTAQDLAIGEINQCEGEEKKAMIDEFNEKMKQLEEEGHEKALKPLEDKEE